MSGPLLRTAGLELWQPALADLPGLVALIADEETRRHLGPMVPSEADCAARLMRNAGCWALFGYGTFIVRRPGDSRIIGNCGVFHSWRGFATGLDDTPEAGWIVHRDCWGQGVAGEAMTAAIEWFDATQGARRIACMIEAGNAASERLAARLGFAAYGRYDDGGEHPLVLYERLPRREI